MSRHPLEGRRLLVVEDEYLIASDLMAALEKARATVYGPVSDLDRAIEIAESFPLDAAILDINLHGKMVFPAADVLKQRSIPFVFVTGYGSHLLPQTFQAAPCMTKPFDERDLLTHLETICCTGNTGSALR